MRKMLFLLLLFPLFSQAQHTEWDIAYNKYIPPNLGKPIHMPERTYNPIIDTIDFRQTDRRVVVVSEDSVYRKLFSNYIYTKDSLKKYGHPDKEKDFYNWLTYKSIERYLIDSIPVIDFSKNELVIYSACAQCLAFCYHNEGRASCHRNACYFREVWFVREKRKNIEQMNKEL
jgi:hypothetical protein